MVLAMLWSPIGLCQEEAEIVDIFKMFIDCKGHLLKGPNRANQKSLDKSAKNQESVYMDVRREVMGEDGSYVVWEHFAPINQ